MEWLRFRMASMKLEERVARERCNTRCLGLLGTGDVMETDDDVTPAGDDVAVAGGDVIQSGDFSASKASDAALASEDDTAAPCDVSNDVTSSGGDVHTSTVVTPTISDVTLSPHDVTSGSDDATVDADADAFSVADASIISVRASPVPDDVTIATDDVTIATNDVTAGRAVTSQLSRKQKSKFRKMKKLTQEKDEATPEQLRELCRRQRRQIIVLKNRMSKLLQKNAALRRRCDPAPEERRRDPEVGRMDPAPEERVVEMMDPAAMEERQVERMDPAAMVEDIKQAAAETAAQLAPSGLAFQPETGLYYDHDSGYYWDPTAQMYYDGTSGYYLRYDDTSGSYVYVEPAGDPSSAAAGPADPADPADPSSDPSTRRRPARATEEELEDGEIEDEEEEEAEEGSTARHHWTGEEYWSRRRMLEARPETMPQYQPELATPAMIESGPRSPQTNTDPPWLRMIVTETKLEGLRLGSLHIATIDGLTAGRDASQQLRLDDTNLSKFHAVIVYRAESAGAGGEGGAGFFIRDLGSRNGTFVDGRRISAAKQESEDTALPHGCQLRLGATCLVCHVHAANDTCLECEPGQTQHKLAPPAPPPPASDARQQRRQVANRIKQKYGLRAGGGAAVGVAPGYSDRAEERRVTKGSAHHSEKTQRADIRQKLPEKNKGFKLLQQMGWKEGSGLGREGQGIVEPVMVEERGERRGLGCHEPAPPVVGKAAKRRTEVWQKTQERFKKLV